MSEERKLEDRKCGSDGSGEGGGRRGVWNGLCLYGIFIANYLGCRLVLMD